MPAPTSIFQAEIAARKLCMRLWPNRRHVDWGPLGCPVHTPSQSHPIRDALETLARESATRKAMIAALGEALYGVKGHTP